jgi:hypothetical protein
MFYVSHVAVFKRKIKKAIISLFVFFFLRRLFDPYANYLIGPIGIG